MLKPDGQLEKTPRRGRGRLALLLVVPPAVLLIWALAGMKLTWGPSTLKTEWLVLAPHLTSGPAFESVGPERVEQPGSVLTWGDYRFRVGDRQFHLGYRCWQDLKPH